MTALETAIPALGGVISSYSDYVLSRNVAALTALASSSPTFSNYVEQRARIDTLVLEGNKLLFIAHSQGNLFANSAYAYSRTKVSADSVKIIHVAPASPTVNGPHILADLDLVINGLRLTGSVPAITHSIPGYLNRPPGLNNRRDILAHGFLEIYMNPAIATRAAIDRQVQTELSALVRPPVTEGTGTVGFFTVTLTWNGTGDVDLHTFEPDSTHVYYAARTGRSGFLDVDNVSANGPEHYYATCDAAALQTGTYRIGINNYARATGRTATVQIASVKEGPLRTRTLSVGAERGSSGNASPIPVFDVVVTRDPATNEYKVDVPGATLSAFGWLSPSNQSDWIADYGSTTAKKVKQPR